MCSLNEKYHPLFELLHKTALAHLQAFLSFEVHLLSFLSIIDVYTFVMKKEGPNLLYDNVATLMSIPPSQNWTAQTAVQRF